MRAPLIAPFTALLLLAALSGGAAHAQTPAPQANQASPAADPAAPRTEKRIERLRTEDAGSRVDEVRYGGETQSITVQTKSGMPEYEIVPNNGARNRPTGERDAASGSSGQRVWKLFNF
jgi:hypothetical protein